MRRLGLHAPLVLWFMILVLAGPWIMGAQAAERGLSQGQTVYVPVHSRVFYGDQERAFELSVTLSIRNTDGKAPIKLIKVAYYDQTGKNVRDFLKKPVELKPWNSTRFFIKESDVTGGAEAFFIVVWQAATQVNPPIIEGLMIGVQGQQGVSFLSRGTPIADQK
ncbi:MAG: DUF3124 domain-containing protein [Syntrophobacterales bacterium]|jgi:hypothetical protein